MAVNGSEFIDNPWNITFSPFTDLFESIFGSGNVFFLFPLVILTFGIYVKTHNAVMASVFMIGSGALLASGSIFTNAANMAFIFTIFTALGIVSLFVSLLFQRGE